MQISEPNPKLNFSPTHTPYSAFGGEAPVRAIVDAFYDRMDVAPEFAGIRALHPTTLEHSRDKLFMFLSGWLGGPSLYIERFGHPRLRARHMPFAIGVSERDQWMQCMRESLVSLNTDGDLREWLLGQLFGTADWMRNQQG